MEPILRYSVLKYLSRIERAQQFLHIYDQIAGIPGGDLDFEVVLPDTEGSSENGIIVFPHTHLPIHTYKYSVLGSAFALRGYDSIFIIPDDTDMLCNIGIVEDDYYEAKSEGIQYINEKILNKFGHNWIYLSDYTDDVSSPHIHDSMGEEELQMFAKASARKATKRYHLDSEGDRELVNKFYNRGITLTGIFERIYNSYNIVAVISHDDKYNLGGIPLDIASKRGIPAYSSTLGWRTDSLMMSNVGDRNSFPHFEDLDLIRKYLKKPLNNHQRRRIEMIMENRMAGAEDVRVKYSSHTELTPDINTNKIVIGMFTNLIWDASLEVSESPFPDVFEWISTTIENLADQSEVELIIKTHPAEERFGTNESIYSWINDNYPYLSANITVLPPDTEVDTYALIDLLDAGIVYNSTVGLEMAYCGIPVVTAGNTHYRNLNITYDPESKEGYLEYINRIGELEMDSRMRRRAERYTYFLFEVKHLSFPFINNSESEEKFRSISRDDIRKGNKILNSLVNDIIQGNPVLSTGLAKN